MKNIDDIIDDFNNDTIDVTRFYGDLETFFKVVDRRGKIDDISMDGWWENDLLLYFYENHKDKFYDYCKIYLDDIEFENGKIYCIRDSAGDFAKLFCNGRGNDYSRDTLEQILEGEYESNFYFYDDIDVWNEVIEELSPKNLQTLKEKFMASLAGEKVSPETNTLKEIASSQGHEDYVIIDSSNIDEIFKDRKTVMYLLKNEIDSNYEVLDDLKRIYSYAMESAYSQHYYDTLWDELTSGYFTGKREYVTRPHTHDKKKMVENVRLEIFNFDNVIVDFLEDGKGYTGDSLLGYWGNFLDVLDHNTECLRVRFDDYVSLDSETLNSYFNDYF